MKKIFTFIAVAFLAMSASAQEKVLFENGGEYGNGATLTSASTTLVLGNDRNNANYNVKLSSCKAYTADLFGQTVQVENTTTGEMEDKTRIVYLVGSNNPKDSLLTDDDKSAGSGYKPENGNLPQSGTYYMITPTKDGHINAYVIVNADKALYVVKGSTGECLAESEMTLKGDGDSPVSRSFVEGTYTLAEKMTGTLEFDVVANETYYVFCTGSKLSFGGYVFTEPETPGDDDDDPLKAKYDLNEDGEVTVNDVMDLVNYILNN